MLAAHHSAPSRWTLPLSHHAASWCERLCLLCCRIITHASTAPHTEALARNAPCADVCAFQEAASMHICHVRASSYFQSDLGLGLLVQALEMPDYIGECEDIVAEHTENKKQRRANAKSNKLESKAKLNVSATSFIYARCGTTLTLGFSYHTYLTLGFSLAPRRGATIPTSHWASAWHQAEGLPYLPRCGTTQRGYHTYLTGM